MLKQCENRIANGERSFWHIGTALRQIQENRLYRIQENDGDHKYETFEQYIEDRWEMSPAQAYRLIDAAKLMTRLQESLQLGETEMPARESHVRQLSRLPVKYQARAWQEVVQHSRSEGDPITAKLIEQKVDEILNRSRRQPGKKRAPKPEPAPVQWNGRTRQVSAFVFELGVSPEVLADQIRDAAIVWYRQQRAKREEVAAILQTVAQELLAD